MSEVRRVDLTTRSGVGAAGGSGGGGGSHHKRPGPICHEERIHSLIPPIEPASLGWQQKTCIICSEKNIRCAAITNCHNSGDWCWVCQLKTAKQQGDKKEILCRVCRDHIEPAFLSRKNQTWSEVSDDGAAGCVAKPYVAEALAHCCDEVVLKAVRAAIKWLCWFPECEFLDLHNEQAWRAHISKVHNRKVCDVCFQKKKSEFLPCQHVLYHPADLGRHKRLGDPIAHVKCPACAMWLYDDEAFFNHWSRANDHVDCQFCQSDGDTRAIFSSFEALQEHHRQCHFVCAECPADGAVFGDYQGLMRHQALEHPKGKRGVVNLADFAAEAANAPAPRGRPPPPAAPLSSAHDLWPDSMIAASPIILQEVDANLKQAPARLAFYDTAYNTAIRNLCGEERAELFRRSFATFLSSKEISASDLLGEFAHLVWTGYWQMFRRYSATVGRLTDKNFMKQGLQTAHLPEARATEIDGNLRATVWPSDLTGAAYWLKMVERRAPAESAQAVPGETRSRRNGHGLFGASAIPCEVVVYFLLHIPPDEFRAKRQELIDALRKVSLDAGEAKKRLRALNEDTPSRAGVFDTEDEDTDVEDADESRDEVTGYYTGPILASCRSLPIRKNLPFVKAAYWAVREFLLRCGNSSLEECRKLPATTIQDMSVQRSRAELSMCSKITSDLPESLLPQRVDLDLILSLRPRYANLSRTQLTVGRRRAGREMNESTRQLVYWRMQACLSKRWGAEADQVFKRISKPNLWLIKEYCKVSSQLLPTATGVLPQLTGGIPPHKLNNARTYVSVDELQRLRSQEASRRGAEVSTTTPSPPPPRDEGELPPLPGYTGYNTWTQQNFRPTGQLNEEQYPPLPAPAPSPPGLTGKSARSTRQWSRQSQYEPALQVCGTCREQFDPDADRCPKCQTWMHLTTSQRAQNLMSREEYPQLSSSSGAPNTSAQPRRWGAEDPAADLVRTYNGRSGPPKRF